MLQGLAYSSQALERRNPTIPGLASTGTGESRREFEQGTIGEPSLYPKDPEWEIIDGNRDYQLIIDFPYHRDREIAVETEDGVLAIRSLKEDAPSRYHVEFALPPEVVEESLRWIFNNGALILHFDKKG
ncbi:MAG: Hsp20/alpha crystallin family protein [Anaerolineae bacterium]|nr:Hsp20/alpha crystallin family protein [Anaerolineae bacterium]